MYFLEPIEQSTYDLGPRDLELIIPHLLHSLALLLPNQNMFPVTRWFWEYFQCILEIFLERVIWIEYSVSNMDRHSAEVHPYYGHCAD